MLHRVVLIVADLMMRGADDVIAENSNDKQTKIKIKNILMHTLNPILLGWRQFCLTIWVKLHKNVIRYVLEI